MDFGDMSKTVKFLEMPSFLPQTPSLNVSTNNQINHAESAMLSPILENETESDSSNSSVIDLDVEVYTILKIELNHGLDTFCMFYKIFTF